MTIPKVRRVHHIESAVSAFSRKKNDREVYSVLLEIRMTDNVVIPELTVSGNVDMSQTFH
jgi:hypothetical protein